MNSFTFPAWYESTTGPGLSQTIMNIVGGFLPVLNLLLASKGYHFLPEAIEPWIDIVVFVGFSVRACFGYIKSKKILGARIQYLEKQKNIHLDVGPKEEK